VGFFRYAPRCLNPGNTGGKCKAHLLLWLLSLNLQLKRYHRCRRLFIMQFTCLIQPNIQSQVLRTQRHLSHTFHHCISSRHNFVGHTSTEIIKKFCGKENVSKGTRMGRHSVSVHCGSRMSLGCQLVTGRHHRGCGWVGGDTYSVVVSRCHGSEWFGVNCHWESTSWQQDVGGHIMRQWSNIQQLLHNTVNTAVTNMHSDFCFNRAM